MLALPLSQSRLDSLGYAKLALDRRRTETRSERAGFAYARATERDYALKLRRIARHVGDLVRGMFNDEPGVIQSITDALHGYADLITPWANSVAMRMVSDASRRDDRAWMRISQRLGKLQRAQLRSPMGDVATTLVNEQVGLIRSIPLDAAERVQTLSLEAITGGRRWTEAAEMIRSTEHVSIAKANLIARTESGRASTAFAQARAQSIGSEGYIWRTARDADVRHIHRELEGTFHNWDDPPVAEVGGQRHHPGAFPNCFTGETLTGPLDDILCAFRALYDGSLIIFGIGETFFRVTPNHPILTLKGWVPAGQLQVGDYVIQSASECFDTFIKDNIDNRLFSFEEIFETFATNWGRGYSFFVDNLYNDRFVNNEIQVIRTELDLSFDWNSSRLKSVSDEMVAGTYGGIEGSTLVGSDLQIRQPFGASRGEIESFLLDSSFGSQRSVSFQYTASCNSFEQEKSFYRTSSDTVTQAQPQLGDTRLILIDNLLSEGRQLRISHRSTEQFYGHVYTLETLSGYYSITPARIVAKNCRCWPEPIIPHYPE